MHDSSQAQNIVHWCDNLWDTKPLGGNLVTAQKQTSIFYARGVLIYRALTNDDDGIECIVYLDDLSCYMISWHMTLGIHLSPGTRVIPTPLKKHENASTDD